jgi:hypothetical protein
VALLAEVPAALRHLLSLRLELDRADALPRRYRDLAAGAALSEASDPVEKLAFAFVTAQRSGRARQAAALLAQLRVYFTDPQLTEFVLVLELSRALDQVMITLG